MPEPYKRLISCNQCSLGVHCTINGCLYATCGKKDRKLTADNWHKRRPGWCPLPENVKPFETKVRRNRAPVHKV